jgi:hypothetical protein
MNRQELMAAMQAPFEMAPLTIKGWGAFHVREISADSVDKINAAAREGQESLPALARTVAAVICDESGQLLFDAGNEDDVKFLASMGFRKLTQVAAAAAKLGRDDAGSTPEGNSPSVASS